MQNLSQNELKQIKRMKNLSRNELEQIAEIRCIKNYKNMSREELSIALLKSEQSHTELYKVNQITQKWKRLEKFLMK